MKIISNYLGRRGEERGKSKRSRKQERKRKAKTRKQVSPPSVVTVREFGGRPGGRSKENS